MGKLIQKGYLLTITFAASLSPIYSATAGLKANFVTNIDPIIVILIFIAACAGKTIGASFGVIISGSARKEALAECQRGNGNSSGICCFGLRLNRSEYLRSLGYYGYS